MVVLPAVFAVTGWALDDKAMATFSSFGTFALLGFADFGGPVRRRPIGYVTGTVVGAGLVALGTVVSGSWLAAALTMLVVGFAVQFVAVFGGYYAAAGTGFTIVLTLIAVAVVVVLVRSASRLRSIGWAIALGLVLGGALGNLTDRLLRAPGVGRGYVVDWISVFGPYGAHFPIFNLADSGITCGAILAGLLALFGIQFDGGREASTHRG